MKKSLSFMAIIYLLTGSGQLWAQESISHDGFRLQDLYNSSKVESRWQMGFHVDWETGEAISVAQKPTTTHCSAYVAALLKRAGIYILRPPEHKAKNLATAQFDYLSSVAGQQAGWRELNQGVQQVQEYANRGYFVVAVVKNDNPTKPGHIAFIYPRPVVGSQLNLADLHLAQAGHINGVDMPLLKGFEKHQKEIGEKRMKFFYNQHLLTKGAE